MEILQELRGEANTYCRETHFASLTVVASGLSLIWLLLENLSSSAKLNKCTGTVFQGLLISLLFDIVQYTIKISVEVKYYCSTEGSCPSPLLSCGCTLQSLNNV
uniref:Uncharacterized protein n=1 Tax=Micrurus lemniscatus lemniscatus TaxID=129467 RepID=A0A2D4JFA4_MICLE